MISGRGWRYTEEKRKIGVWNLPPKKGSFAQIVAGKFYRPAAGWKGQLLIAVTIFTLVALGVSTGMTWLSFAGFATLFGIVVRTLVKAHRFFANLPCPRCGEPVGKYETRKTRLHLCCVHCGHVAPTDCRIYYSGQMPEKG